MLRAHRQASKTKFYQLFANGPLMHDNAKALLNLALEVNAPPAHHAVRFGIRPLTHKRCQLRLLCHAEQGLPSWRTPVRETLNPRVIVTVYPVTQRLAVHPAVLGRRLAVSAVQNQRNRQHPSGRFRVPARRSGAPKIAGRLVRSHNLYCHQYLL